MNHPFVSICIPTYNGDKYIIECLNSCMNQTFKDYEIIICDDGSSDNTISIIEDYASRSESIKFFKNDKNLGLVANWNKCINLSTGKWIKFVFQDDYITYDCLQKFVNEIREDSQLIVCKRHFLLPDNVSSDVLNYYTNEVRTLENTSSFKGKYFGPELISRIAVQNICLNFIGEPSLIFFKKSITNETGLFNDSLKQICDLEFALRVSSKYGLNYIPEQLCAFRIHNESTTNLNVSNKYFDIHYIEPLLFSYLLLFDKCFKSFRSYLSFLQKLKLNLYFKLKANNANLVNVKEKRDHYLFSDSNTKFKEVNLYKKGSLLVRLIAAIRH
ncbi:MAG: glycosyltransferase family 2 protein [Bacteroidota bacterium]